MSKRHTPSGHELTELILATFQLNGVLLAEGDKLVKDLDLTSARWQVLGAISLAGRPLTAAQISRRMGISRQAVQRLVNELEREGLLTFGANPDHKRSRLVSLTALGQKTYTSADARQVEWANALASGLAVRDLSVTTRILKTIHERLAQGAD